MGITIFVTENSVAEFNINIFHGDVSTVASLDGKYKKK